MVKKHIHRRLPSGVAAAQVDNPVLPPELLSYGGKHVVFSCPPMWTEPGDQVREADWGSLGSRYHVLESGWWLKGPTVRCTG